MNKKELLILMSIAIWLILVFFYFGDFVKLKLLLGSGCEIQAYCGDLIGVNCKAEIDGPYYYVKKDTGKIVSLCGGYCRGGKCTNCPPQEWTCERY